MKFLVPALIVIIIILVAALSFTLGKGSTTKMSDSSPSVSPTVMVSPTQALTPAAENTKKVTGGGILSFPKWQLTASLDWQESRESSGSDSEKVTLSKDGYEISITQGGFGGAMCLYPGDADIEGPSTRYDNYKAITTQSGDALRRSWTGDELTAKGFGICQNTQYGWEAPTLYGHIAFTTPAAKTKAMLEEMDTILSSLTKL
jgi:hypothetical protein